MKKMLFVCILASASILFTACGSDNTASDIADVSETDNVIDFGDEIEVQTDEGNFTITLVDVHEVDWSHDRDGAKIVTIQAEVYNESYDDESAGGLYNVFLAEYVSLVDDEGYDLEFYPISGGDDGLYEVGAITPVSSQKRVSLPYYVSEDCENVKVRIQESYTDDISLNDSDDTDEASNESLDIDTVVSKIENCTYNSVDTAEELIDEYFSQFDDEQKESCLLALAKCEAPSDLEDEIKDSLKSPRSFYLYECTVYDYPTYDEDEDRYNVTVKMKYGATNSYGAEETNEITAFCYYKLDLSNGNVSCVDITLFDF